MMFSPITIVFFAIPAAFLTFLLATLFLIPLYVCFYMINFLFSHQQSPIVEYTNEYSVHRGFEKITDQELIMPDSLRSSPILWNNQLVGEGVYLRHQQQQYLKTFYPFQKDEAEKLFDISPDTSVTSSNTLKCPH